MWNWIEKINQREQEKYFNLNNNVEDRNQNNLMSLHFGMTDYERLKYMMRMADLLKERKKYQKMIQEDKSGTKKYDFELKISVIKEQSK